MNVPLRIVSSMATREVLAELVAAYAMRSPPAGVLVVATMVLRLICSARWLRQCWAGRSRRWSTLLSMLP